jgi:pimeloyl-ACP methyl ester carboxylesterase
MARKITVRFGRMLVFVVAVAGILARADGAAAQALKDVQTPDTPLVLKAQGSFYVGGEKAEQTQGELGNLGPGGHITVNQMYVRYMVPQGGDGNVPVVMVHGATLTGKSWETTPDGRMGWDEYFVRKGHPVYVPDQVGRGRSGFNQAIFNNVRTGAAPPANQPVWLRFSDEGVWPNFRFGTAPGQPYSDSQFPLTALDELSKQGVPDVNRGGLPTPNPTLKALADLAGQLSGAVLMGHSQSGSFPLEAALINPAAARALVLVEPGSCPATYTPEQIATLAKVPILVVFGDHRDTPTGIPTLPTWQARFEACQAFIGRITSAGGKAQMLNPPERGIRGNSHMIMQDKNSLQVADLILQWIDERAGKPTQRNKE